MKFEDALHTMSGLLDMCYDSGIKPEDYNELEKAEATLYLLVKKLKDKGVEKLEDLDR